MPCPDVPERSLFFFIAGEASGDFLGAALMRALQKRTDGNVRFMGVGGPRMEAQGLSPLFAQSDLAHMGIVEVARHLPLVARRLRETIDAVRRARPAALVTIDSPDFCLRVAKALKGTGIPLIHYVAPSVWAWRPARAKKIARILDHLLALLPFEPPYFAREGLPCTFVGHPLVESGIEDGHAERFRAARGIGPDATLLCLLPGSRRGEVARLLPVFRDTIVLLRAVFPLLQVVVPTVEGVESLVRAHTDAWPVPVHILMGDDRTKADAYAASRAALACSGTVSVELALAGLPSAIAYKIGAITAFLSRLLIKTRFVTLVNIMAGRAVMPEFLQQDCVPEKLAAALVALIKDEPVRDAMQADMKAIGAWLGRGQFVPSEKAAQTVWRVAFGEGEGASCP